MPAREPIDFLVDGRHYDAVHDERSGDLGFFLERAAQSAAVLDLGCGTGRVSIPIAEMGTPVVGVDISPNFLAHAARKSELRGVPTTWHCADLRDFSLNRKFDLVILPFRTIAILLTSDDLNACLSSVCAHLTRGGTFIFEAFNAARQGDRKPRSSFSYADPATAEPIQVDYERSYDPVTAVETGLFRFAPSGHTRELQLRFHATAELLGALSDHNLQVTEHLGDYQGTAFNGTTPCQVIVSRLA
jgi:2-polyprenyl-3-methyl-5-hydroxy-6-metoxy-1,4-benzoquinol methylase